MAYNNNCLSPAYLELVHGGDGKVSPVIELIEPQVTIGRSPGNTHVWSWPNASRRHATFIFQDGKWLIKNTSSNGMMLNFIPFVKDLSVALQNHDIITFNVSGGVHYRFVTGGTPGDVNESEDDDVLFQTVVSAVSGMLVSPRYSVSLDQANEATATRNPHANLLDLEVKEIEEMLGNASPPVRSPVLPRAAEVPENLDVASKGFNTPTAKIRNKQELEKWGEFQRVEDLYWVKMQMERYKERIRLLTEEKEEAVNEIQKQATEVKLVIQNLQQEKAATETNFRRKFMDCCESELECAVCKQIARGAVLIDCGHTFCLSCLSAWMGRRYDCPKCRHPLRNIIKVHSLQNYVEKFCAPFMNE